MDSPGQPQQPQQPSQPPPQVNTLFDSYESSEQALMNSFKAAAFSVTQLYKDSMRQNRRAYAAGYEQCLQDLYGFLTSHPTTLVNSDQAVIPVQDLFNFARSKNAQLQSEARKNNDQDVPSTPQHSSPPASAQPPAGMPLPQRTPQQQHPTQKSPAPFATQTQPISFPTQQQQQGFSAFTQPPPPASIFGSDNAQFTFGVPTVSTVTYMAGIDDMIALGGNQQQQQHTSGGNGGENLLKRRHNALSDFTFMGRPMNIEQYGGGYEPLLKRGRARRDDM